MKDQAMPGSAKSESNTKNFARAIGNRSRECRSRIILALDLDYRDNASKLLPEAISIIKKTNKYLCAVKLNFHLIAPLSLSELAKLNQTIASHGLTTIADIKLNDIGNTNRVATEYLWAAGFSAVIANPFVGYTNALDVVFEKARRIGKGVILLAYMSHKGAEEGYGLELRNGKTVHELLLQRAKSWKADGVIIGTTKPEKISAAKTFLGSRIKIFSPGSGPQGGDPNKSLKAGADYLIFGRSIVESKNPQDAVKRIYRSQLAWTKNH